MEVHSTFKGDVSKIPNHIVNHGEYVIVMLITCKYHPPGAIIHRRAFSTRSKIVRACYVFACMLKLLLVYCSHQNSSLVWGFPMKVCLFVYLHTCVCMRVHACVWCVCVCVCGVCVWCVCVCCV